MRFNTLLLSVSAAASIARAIDLCAWPSSGSCTGFATCCFGIAKNACCGNLVQTVGFSASYRPLASAVAFGQAWTSTNCGDGPIGTNQVGPGDRCWTGLGLKANSIAWANFGDRRRDEPANFTETVSPNAFVYLNAKGQQTSINIPEHDGAVEALIELHNKGDFAALESHEGIERTE